MRTPCSISYFSLIFSSKNDELDFLNAAQVVHHCATIDPDIDVAVGRVATEDMKVGGQSSEGGEGKCNVCLPHSLVERPERERLCRRLYIIYTRRMSGEQTAVNIVLLKNRTLVNVFERVRNGGRGRG